MAQRWTAGSYGKSDYTPTKQEHLRQVATMVLCAARKVQENHGWPCETLLCADLTAGPGVDDAGDEGSPLVLIEAVRQHALQAQSWFFESDPERGTALSRALCPYQDSPAFPLSMFVEDCQSAFPRQLDLLGRTVPLRRVFGLIYADPTTEVPWSVLADASERLPRVDILISLPATTIKRVCGVHGESGQHIRLEHGMAMVAKKVWLIRELMGRHQWTFLLGTNYPAMHECRRIGLVRLESPAGQRIWQRACLTHEQLEQRDREGQLPLF